MSPFKLLSLEETVAVADAAYERANREPFDPRRAATGLSSNAIVSMVVLVRQLDGIAEAAARAEDAWRRVNDGQGDAQEAANASIDLIRLLSAAGYLPLPPVPTPEEAAHGQG